ncbi:MAG TPA: SusC/RagA family TonB-linked outer membrane protein, partial [Chitinophagaceae bacterium]|nr:SusC/RagA family TonB-linked outer membrane protein [Chitinophagaceae bacterium]
KVNFNTVNSISQVTKQVSVLNGDQVRAIVNQLGTADQKAMLGTANTNWQDQIYRNAFATDNNINLTGGIKGLPYRLSIGYSNQDGILKTDNLQKTSVTLALNPVLFDKHLKIDLNLKGSAENTRFGNTGAIGAAIYFDPTKPVYSNSKSYNGYWEWTNPDGSLNNLAGKNPLGMLNQRFDEATPQRSIGNLQIDYKFHFLPDLHANVNLGYDAAIGKGTIYVPDSAAMEYTRYYGENNHYKSTKWNTLGEFYLNYLKDIGKHHIDVTAGYSYNNYQTTNYFYPDYLANGTINPSSPLPNYPYDKPENTLISYFGRANYSFDSKYLLTVSVRRDASSRFGPANRWGTFPAGAFAWKLKQESFLKNSNIVSDLKLRIGYGITGQQDGIDNYSYISYYGLSSTTAAYQFGDSYYQMYRPSGFYPNRKWEQTATSNIGVDFGFLNNRITGSVDVYLKKTKDLLNQIPQPAGTNFSAYILANVGNMENKGIEASINVIPVQTKDFQWDFSFNVTYNKNTITNLTVVPDDKNYLGFQSGGINGVQGFAFLNAVGGPKNTFYLYKQVYDEKTGLPIEGLMYDKNRDGIINENDKFKGKSADPTVFMGFSTNISYKKWTLGLVMRSNINNYVYNNIYSNNGRLNQILSSAVIGNASSSYLATHFTGISDIQLLSDYYLQNASFLRMDNANLTYNAGKIYHGRATLSVSAIVQNVFVITKYTGLDPEISSGIDNNFYPRPRIYSLGINLGF